MVPTERPASLPNRAELMELVVQDEPLDLSGAGQSMT